MSKPKLCFVTAVPMTINVFLLAHIERLIEEYEVYVVADFSEGKANVPSSVIGLSVPLAREISAVKDIRALSALRSLFVRHAFDIVISVTPKAGLLSVMAGYLAGVRCRIHWFTGQVWVTQQGLRRWVLKAADRLVARLATSLLADSPSQREFLIEQGVVRADKVSVIADGSICGVDTARFCPNADAGLRIRVSIGIPGSASVVLYLGRLNIDKGVRELAGAMEVLGRRYPEVHWLFVGPDEGEMEAEIRRASSGFSDRVHFHGFTPQPEHFMAAANLFCLPSHREGFGSSILEAAAVGIPGVATRIYGLTDAVEDGVTGLLVPPRDVKALAEALVVMIENTSRREAMGRAARQRALSYFSTTRIVDGLVAFLADRNVRRGL